MNGEFLGFVCNACNLLLKPRKMITDKRNDLDKSKFFIPVICHNMKGYDSHHILRSLGADFESLEIKAIASNTEKFISFSIDAFRFLNSLQFLNCSLDSLVTNLRRSDSSETKFALTSRHYDPSLLKLVIRKGIYP